MVVGGATQNSTGFLTGVFDMQQTGHWTKIMAQQQSSTSSVLDIKSRKGCQILTNKSSLADIMYLIFSKCNTFPSSLNHISKVGDLSDFQDCKISFLANNVERETALDS